MSIPQINPYDYFYQWREKTNLFATLVGDIETINVAAADRDTLVEALNKVISNIGTLSTLTTTAKNTIVAAINEHQTKMGTAVLTTTAQNLSAAVNELEGEHGTLSSLTTTTKISLVAAINELDAEHGTLSSLTTSYKATFVGAINELLDKIGPLATLSTTVKDNLVDAINELDTAVGDLSTLKTTAKTSTVHAINEVFDSLLISDATLVVGSESTNVIRVTVQLKAKSGSNLAIRAGVQAYLSDHSDGSSLVATAPSGGWAIGTTGVMIPLETNKASTFISHSSGAFNVDITEAAGKTMYLVVVLPLGNIKISSAITFT